MATHRIRTRSPRATNAADPAPPLNQDVAPYLEDAAHYPGGHAPAVAFPRDESELASVLCTARTVLPIGAQSSLTGGATPRGELLLSMSKFTRLAPPTRTSVTVEPGVTLAKLRTALTMAGRWYPPTPTYEGATIGGVGSTNAAGAATFKYGPTRPWGQRLTIMLASGELLDLERGQIQAAQGRFEIITQNRGTITIPVPSYRIPAVPKCSAGYHAEPGMDLIDLFIGSEGTLGIVTSITLDVLPRCSEMSILLIALDNEPRAVSVASQLRDVSLRTRQTQDPQGLDVAAIEYLDRRCLELLREDGTAVPENADALLLAQIELPSGMTTEQIHEQVGLTESTNGATGPIAQLCHLLAEEELLDATELAAPNETTRCRELLALREAVPDTVNRRIGFAKRTIDRAIEKTATDMVVPFSMISESLAALRTAFDSRGLDYAIWGHLSDAHLHANLLPQTGADVVTGHEAILDCGRAMIRLGGSPLAEHGVGRNPIKQTLLRLLHGTTGIDQMRAVKYALDPENKLAPGVLLPPTHSSVIGTI